MFDISLNIFTEYFPDILQLKFVNFFKKDLSQQRNSSGVVTRLRCSIFSKIPPLFFSIQAPSSIISAKHLPTCAARCDRPRAVIGYLDLARERQQKAV